MLRKKGKPSIEHLSSEPRAMVYHNFLVSSLSLTFLLLGSWPLSSCIFFFVCLLKSYSLLAAAAWTAATAICNSSYSNTRFCAVTQVACPRCCSEQGLSRVDAAAKHQTVSWYLCDRIFLGLVRLDHIHLIPPGLKWWIGMKITFSIIIHHNICELWWRYGSDTI